MNSKLARINSEMARQITDIIAHRLSDPRLGDGIIGVTSVKTTDDLKYAKVYLSIINVEKPEDALKIITNAKGFIRNELKGKMDIRNLPELTFYLDTSAEYGMKIDKLLKEIKEKDENRE